jgi:hypothetical protein
MQGCELEGSTMKMFATAALIALVAGCASNTPEMKPTHYWESAAKAPENRYRADNLACQAQVEADAPASMFEPDSKSFETYRECMISRGYVLRQY